ncbi:HAD family hydrolase [Aliivibrio kagoshimensis]|uniref:HAD family hydrolase n=1 Tax=Aliivibrio kagoshimensis TaxID=2910230 RepID=UPI003D0BA7EB
MPQLHQLPSDELSKDWSKVQIVLTDVDDTLTCDGQLPPDTLHALAQLQEAGILVYAVTGACAGWCDHIAQLWPVDGVLGENGAFLLTKVDGHLTVSSSVPLATIREQQQKLKLQVCSILESYPDLSLTLDQSYRLCEVAIDIGQNCPKVQPQIVAEVMEEIHALGANATASSIHINAWYGIHSKKNASLALLSDLGFDEQSIQQAVCYVGDSLNDQQMFNYLDLSVGVSNIVHYWDQLQYHPAVVMQASGGYGFAEFSRKLLALK